MAIQAAGTPAHPKRQTGGYGVDGGERMVELSGGSARPGMGVGFWPEPDEMRQIISFGVTGQAGDLGVYGATAMAVATGELRIRLRAR